jgi:hypothetical protein
VLKETFAQTHAYADEVPKVVSEATQNAVAEHQVRIRLPQIMGSRGEVVEKKQMVVVVTMFEMILIVPAVGVVNAVLSSKVEVCLHDKAKIVEKSPQTGTMIDVEDFEEGGI